mmetsp:Transcript_34223/g.94547  ORF Transcript_34223/g.94547 Transcript_34223/m.94547 type:complete len:237 (-) Transcript_34223:20-730(-)
MEHTAGAWPAEAQEPCCGCCPLFWGVKMISLVSVSVGTFSLLSLSGAPFPGDQDAQGHPLDNTVKNILLVHYAWAVFHVAGLMVGCQGLVGLRTRDAVRIRGLCYYYAVTLILEVPTFIYYIAGACHVLHAVKLLERKVPGERLPSCEKERWQLFEQAIILCTVHACFARAAWALAKYFERGPTAGPLLGEEDTEDGGLRAPLLAWPVPTSSMPRQAPAPRAQGFRPFSGRPQRLE